MEEKARALAPKPRPNASTTARAAAPHRADLQRKLSDHLGTKVLIQPGKTKGSGRVVIEFYTFDQFEGLMQRLGFETSKL